MYEIELMTKGERKDLKHYHLDEVRYKEIKGEIENSLEIQIGSVNLTKLKKGSLHSVPWFYPFVQNTLREAADGIADMLRAKYWLTDHLKNERTEESRLIYRLYAYHVLEK